MEKVSPPTQIAQAASKPLWRFGPLRIARDARLGVRRGSDPTEVPIAARGTPIVQVRMADVSWHGKFVTGRSRRTQREGMRRRREILLGWS